MTEKEIRRYLKKSIVQSNVSLREQRELYAQFSDDVCQFLAEHPDADQNDLYAYFGSPADVAHQYLMNLPQKTLLRKFRLTKFHRTLIISSIVMIIVVGMYYMIGYNNFANRERPYYYQTEIVYDTDRAKRIQKQILPCCPGKQETVFFQDIMPLKKP